MLQSDIRFIEEQLRIELPEFYINTMLHYPYPEDSFAAERSLSRSVEHLIRLNAVFENTPGCFAIGSDGGEFIYFLRLGEDEKVYIYNHERSDEHRTVEAETWEDYLRNLQAVHEEILQDELKMTERRKNRKWWQFWV